jgi:hypothetical protein
MAMAALVAGATPAGADIGARGPDDPLFPLLRRPRRRERPGTWDPAPGLVSDAADLFGDSVYDRGAMTLQALRVEVGDGTFLRILRDWFAEHEYGNATTADFTALAQRDARRDLRRFFQKWLFTSGPVVTAAAASAAPQPAVAQLAAQRQRRR